MDIETKTEPISKKKTKIFKKPKFFFDFLLKGESSDILWVSLFFFIGFILPRMLLYQFGLGVPWYNFFYFSQDLIDSAPTYWQDVSPHLDFFNIFSVIVGIPLLFFAKKMYKECLRVEKFIKEHPEDPLEKTLAESSKEITHEKFGGLIRSVFSRNMKIVVIAIFICLPLITIFLIDYPLLKANFDEVLLTEIIQIHGYLFVYLVFPE